MSKFEIQIASCGEKIALGSNEVRAKDIYSKEVKNSKEGGNHDVYLYKDGEIYKEFAFERWKEYYGLDG